MNYLMVGKDSRYGYLRSLLDQSDFCETTPADLLILGPRDSCKKYLPCLRPHAYVLSGIDSNEELASVGLNRLTTSECFRVKNSRVTAEGALCLAIAETRICLLGASVLVLGFGYLGKEVAALFRNFGCCVTICSREQKELTLARSMGYSTLHLSKLSALPYSVILNTIPHGVLSLELLQTAPSDSILIELASIPCCKCAAKAIRTIDARGLPGRFAPASAASYFMEEIENWKERKQTIWNDSPIKT